ncbi:hypothetical protein HY029_00150 [Candidatus Gottesmanbacteria bacterium]|nr:hypothetical protein [Candidatus Gottesmanbacteria bacterium]
MIGIFVGVGVALGNNITFGRNSFKVGAGVSVGVEVGVGVREGSTPVIDICGEIEYYPFFCDNNILWIQQT